ncbi:hypothetical protein D3C80_1714850 [compost metagenome]
MAAGVRADGFPEQGVVSMTATVVTNCSTDAFRYAVQIGDQFFNRFGLKLGCGFECSVQVCYISVVVAIVVNRHCSFIDMRLKSVVSVR